MIKLRKLGKTWTGLLADISRFYGIATPIPGDIFLAGGAITSTLNKEHPKDYDLFCKNAGLTLSLVKSILKVAGLNEFAESFCIVDIEGNPKLKRIVSDGDFGKVNEMLKSSKCGKQCLVFVSDTAFTFNNGVQLITSYIGEPAEVFKHFDFLHCMCYMTTNILADDPEVHFKKGALEAWASKTLVYNEGSDHLITSYIRSVKFASRGWNVPLDTILHIIKDLNKLDLTSKEVVRYQLMGIYGISQQLDEFLDKATDITDFSKLNFNKLVKLVEGLV